MGVWLRIHSVSSEVVGAVSLELDVWLIQQVVQLRSVGLQDGVSLQFLRVGQEAVLVREGLVRDVDALDSLDLVQVVFGGQVVQLSQDGRLDVSEVQKQVLLHIVAGVDALHVVDLVLVDGDDCNQVAVLGVDIDTDLVDQWSV